MRRRLAAVLFASLGLAAGPALPAMAMKKHPPGHTTELPRPREGNAARQELAAARQAGTVAAYDMFLSRHGDHPLAATARRERAAIASGKPVR